MKLLTEFFPLKNKKIIPKQDDKGNNSNHKENIIFSNKTEKSNEIKRETQNVTNPFVIIPENKFIKNPQNDKKLIKPNLIKILNNHKTLDKFNFKIPEKNTNIPKKFINENKNNIIEEISCNKNKIKKQATLAQFNFKVHDRDLIKNKILIDLPKGVNLKLFSWNVNGLRGFLEKGILEYFIENGKIFL